MAAAVWKVNMARLVSLLLALVLALSCVQVLVYGEAPARAEASGEAASSDPGGTQEETEGQKAPWYEPPASSAGERFFPDYTLEDYRDVMYASGTILDNLRWGD